MTIVSESQPSSGEPPAMAGTAFIGVVLVANIKPRYRKRGFYRVSSLFTLAANVTLCSEYLEKIPCFWFFQRS
jgi:hypothetical protein